MASRLTAHLTPPKSFRTCSKWPTLSKQINATARGGAPKIIPPQSGQRGGDSPGNHKLSFVLHTFRGLILFTHKQIIDCDCGGDQHVVFSAGFGRGGFHKHFDGHRVNCGFLGCYGMCGWFVRKVICLYVLCIYTRL